MSLDNDTAFNHAFQAVSFGNGFSFDISFGGAFLSSGASVGTSFVLGLFVDDEITPLLTTDPNGTLLTTDLLPGGAITHLTFTADSSGSPSVVSVSAVPIPAALWLLLSGLGLMPWRSRQKP